MNVDEFQKQTGIREFAKTELPDMIRERLSDYQLTSVYASETVKNNGKVLLGITVVPKGQEISPCIYVEPYIPPDPSRLRGKETWSKVADRLANDFRYALDSIKPESVTIFDPAGIEENLVLELVNREKNLELLKDRPYRSYLDLAAIMKWRVFCGGRAGTVAISNEVTETWDIPVDELFDIALQNTMRLYPPRVDPLDEVIREISQGILSDIDSPFYYVGTKHGLKGSIALLYPGLLRQIYETIGETYYLIPSSINELLALPESYESDQDRLRDLIWEVNTYMLDRSDVLADTLYRYNPEYDKLEMLLLS